MKLPIAPRPVGPGRLALRYDPTRFGPRWAIVSETPLPGGLVGYKRGYGENHQGLYAYRFKKWATARKVLRRLLNNEPIQDGLA